MADPVAPPAPATPPTQQILIETPAPTPAPAARTAAEVENELLRAQLAGKEKDKDLHKAKEDKKRSDEQLSAARQALRAAGIITGDDPADAKVILEKQEKDARSKERREAAIERAALKKLIPTGLGEDDADLILGKALRDHRVSFDETTGTVTGLDEVFAALEPTIKRLGAKPVGAAPPSLAPPVPPSPSPGGAPPDAKFAAVKTGKDYMLLPASVQEEYEKNYPAEAKKFEAEFHRNLQAGRAPAAYGSSTVPAAPMPAPAAPARR
jgi:hypothetical protein